MEWVTVGALVACLLSCWAAGRWPHRGSHWCQPDFPNLIWLAAAFLWFLVALCCGSILWGMKLAGP